MKGVAVIRLPSGQCRVAELHWYEAHGIGRVEIKRKGISRDRIATARFAVCIANEGYEASLERNKIYAVVEDWDATADGDIRIVDESGEDYLYPSTWFVMIEVPQAVQDSVIRATA